jgi:hypothetical protein
MPLLRSGLQESSRKTGPSREINSVTETRRAQRNPLFKKELQSFAGPRTGGIPSWNSTARHSCFSERTARVITKTRPSQVIYSVTETERAQRHLLFGKKRKLLSSPGRAREGFHLEILPHDICTTERTARVVAKARPSRAIYSNRNGAGIGEIRKSRFQASYGRDSSSHPVRSVVTERITSTITKRQPRAGLTRHATSGIDLTEKRHHDTLGRDSIVLIY